MKATIATMAVLAAACGRSSPSGGNPATVTPHTEAPFVAALVRLASDPKSMPSGRATDDSGDGRPSPKDRDLNYEYTRPPSIAIETLYLTIRKTNPAAWEVGLSEAGIDGGVAIRADDFAPSGGLLKLPERRVVEGVDHYEITAGAAKGLLLQHEGERFELRTPAFVAAK